MSRRTAGLSTSPAADAPGLSSYCAEARPLAVSLVISRRQRFWHYGVARIYLAALPFCLLGLLHHSAWWAVPLLLGALRVGKSLWVRRDGRPLSWLCNPVQFVGVASVLAAIDLATFLGWLQAVVERPVAPREENP